MITIASETENRSFGSEVAADGPVVAFADIAGNCPFGGECTSVVRIGRVTNDRFVQEARLPTGEAMPLWALAVDGDLVMARLRDRRILTFRRIGTRWIQGASIALPAACQDNRWPVFRKLHLSGDTLVVEAPERLCVYDRGASGVWELTAMLDRQREPVAFAAGRLAVVANDRIAIKIRIDGRWQHRNEIVLPGGAHPTGAIALSERWLVVGDRDRRLVYVFDLDHDGRLHTTLETADWAAKLVLGDSLLLVVSRSLDEIFELRGDSWENAGAIVPPHDTSRSPAVGTWIWLGMSNPHGSDGDHGQGGVVRGYR